MRAEHSAHLIISMHCMAAMTLLHPLGQTGLSQIEWDKSKAFTKETWSGELEPR